MNKIDTIFALATPPGKSGVAIIRVSGSGALKAAKLLTNIQSPETHTAYVTDIFTHSGEKLDKGVIIYFKAPKSFTGEDIIELQTHGSTAVIKAITDELRKIENFRYANAGEFAKRGFLNGKLDLTQAEALEDLINANTKLQLKQALAHLDGDFKNQIELWRSELIEIMALAEAMIDFPDEDIPLEVFSAVRQKVEDLSAKVKIILNDNRGIEIRNGIYVTISGKPNVGKSSLMNYLVQREVSIVSDIPGTTRDIVEVTIDLKGLPIIFADTAGLRETEDKIESIGIDRAKKAIEKSVLNIYLLDAQDTSDLSALKITDKDLIVINKIDLMPVPQSPGNIIFAISAKDGTGIEKLLDEIFTRLLHFNVPDQLVLTTRERQHDHLRQTIYYLQHFLNNHDLVLAAEDLRLAKREFETICGLIDVEHILDKIFSSFCIGK